MLDIPLRRTDTVEKNFHNNTQIERMSSFGPYQTDRVTNRQSFLKNTFGNRLETNDNLTSEKKSNDFDDVYTKDEIWKKQRQSNPIKT